MGRKKCAGFVFETYANDHLPFHVHVFQGNLFLGRFDIENRKPLDKRLKITQALRNALKKCGYLE
ncbi:MAG: hypothetical protein M0Q96_05590 [Candidatus Omnitrophica bacterium]|jgi:hypothetical protein|nr:hypothetical protein [Candidatus Omnitrophota bacterium]